MGTRGQFYLYVNVAGKRLLIYTTYTHWDGFMWLIELETYLESLFKEQNIWSVPDLVRKLVSKFDSTDGFASDAEAVGHVLLETPEIDMDLTKCSFEKHGTCTYGSEQTGEYGDCYYVNSFNDIPDVATSNYIVV